MTSYQKFKVTPLFFAEYFSNEPTTDIYSSIQYEKEIVPKLYNSTIFNDV